MHVQNDKNTALKLFDSFNDMNDLMYNINSSELKFYKSAYKANPF